MRNIDEWTITQEVLDAQRDCSNPRLKSILTSLISHLHAFAREVKLTEAEWHAGIQFLTDAGHITDDKRQEFILLSDTLGLSTLVTAQNTIKPSGFTESTVLGPFFVADAPEFPNGADIANGAPGEPCFVSGTVRGKSGDAISGARISVWQSDENGFYDVQRPEINQAQGRGNLHSRPDGSFHFKSTLAAPYPIPYDGPVGKMLEALGRHPWRPAHLHFRIAAQGYDELITHIFRADGPYLDSDAVFGVRSSLIADWKRHEPGVAPDGSTSLVAYYTVLQDFPVGDRLIS